LPAKFTAVGCWLTYKLNYVDNLSQPLNLTGNRPFLLFARELNLSQH
jgi:hypothetical protein